MDHRLVNVDGTRIHLVEHGTGPTVVFVHGFPESWFSWRHQLGPVAEAGYHAVAIDVRGYGRSSHPAELEAYRITELAKDVAGVIDAVSNGPAVLVGHDWGSPVVTATTLLHPAQVRATAMLSVPYRAPGGPRPTETFARVGGDDQFYISYFQEPGVAEAEIEPDVRGWLEGIFTSISGETVDPSDPVWFRSPGATMRARFVTGRRPSWLTDEVLDEYAGEFERTGLTGPLNRYRNMDRDWEDLAAYEGRPLTVPTLFVAGGADDTVKFNADAVAAFGRTLPGLRGSHILDGVGHWIQQEAPAETTALLLAWLRDL